MTKIVVFDSGLGSLSIIKSVQKYTKSKIIYLADQKSYPYGKKSKSELAKIIKKTIAIIQERFSPDLVIIGSNTPTILLDIKDTSEIIGVRPPIKQAIKITKTKNIAMLGTQSVIQSNVLTKFIAGNKISKNVTVHKINCSALVELVESGDFIDKPYKTTKTINRILANIIINKKIDVAMLSSTHLPFLKKYLIRQFPTVEFIDPADDIAKKIIKNVKPISKNQLKIYCIGKTKVFEKNLDRLQIKNKVTYL